MSIESLTGCFVGYFLAMALLSLLKWTWKKFCGHPDRRVDSHPDDCGECHAALYREYKRGLK